MRVFVDSNVPMYVAGRDHPNRAPARRFLERVRSGEIDACTSTEVLRDAAHVAVMLDNDVTLIATFDLAFDGVPGVSRVPLR